MGTLWFCSNVRMSLKAMLEATMTTTTTVQSVAEAATSVPQKQLAAARRWLRRWQQRDSNMSVASHRGLQLTIRYLFDHFGDHNLIFLENI